jgi:hypothetical protein
VDAAKFIRCNKLPRFFFFPPESLQGFSLSLVTGLRAERYDPAGLGSYPASIDGAVEDVEHFFAGVLPGRPDACLVNNLRWSFRSGVLWNGLRDERVRLQVPV